jgi:lipoprotein NlpI
MHIRHRHALVFSLLLAALRVPAPAAHDDVASLSQQATSAARQGDFPKALGLADQVVQAAPKQTQSWLLRGEIHERRRDFAKAAADYGEAVKLDPKLAVARLKRGEAYFRDGKIAQSLPDFDKALTLAPDERFHLWQRGIALYYAGKYKEGKQQFELHQTVNPRDVENAVWHFLCTVRAEGLEAARKQLIPIEGDRRVPMTEVHRLFAGKGTPEEVSAAAEAAPASRGYEPVFYANLYLGLYYEAIGDGAKAREFMRKAAARAKENGYMGDVARVHPALKSKPK